LQALDARRGWAPSGRSDRREKAHEHIIKVKSGSKYEDLLSYSRLVVAGDMIYVPHAAGRNCRTREIAPDARGQAEQASRNVEGALASVGTSLRGGVQVRAFVPDISDREALREIVGAKFRGIDPANTTVCTPLGKPEMKFEIEVTAYRRRNPDEPEKRLTIALT
jgi:enamine deaminase RidA (YjgF/YER057c/UK114 family)